jgi:hypothetical protein
VRILDPIPIWALFLLTVGYCVLLFEIGYRMGRRLRRRYPELEVGGVLLVILDLDRTQQGFLRIVQAPLMNLETQIGTPSP